MDRGRTPAHPLIHSGCPLLNLVHIDFEFIFRKTYEKLIIYLFFEEKYQEKQVLLYIFSNKQQNPTLTKFERRTIFWAHFSWARLFNRPGVAGAVL